MNEYLSPQEIADRLKVTRRTVYQWIADGLLPSVKLGAATVRIAEKDLEAFLRERRKGGGQ